MTFSRWPAVVILVALLAGAWVVDRDHEREQSSSEDATTPLEAQGYLPVSAPEDALTSTWYCAGGTASADGRADTTVIVANATDRELNGSATIFPSIPSQIVIQEDTAETPDTTTTTEAATTTEATTTTEGTTPSTTATAPPLTEEPVAVDLTVPARDRVELRLADEVEAPYAAALVELPGGAISVEQRVDGPNGADVSPCTTQAADAWFFASGRTTADAVETLAFFNPFPDPAVVDVTFRTEEDLRTPIEFEAYAVPAQSLVVEDIGELVTRRDHVSVSIVARSGRLVVNRLLDLDGSEGSRGLDVSAGAPRPATTWYFPDGVVAEGVRETFVVYNPGDTAAEIDLVLEPDEVDRFGAIEPFGLTIPPEGYQEVAVQDEERIGTALGAAEGESVLRHGARVVSVNEVPVVAERIIEGDDTTDRPGFDLMFGAPLLMELGGHRRVLARPVDRRGQPVGEHAGAGHLPLPGRWDPGGVPDGHRPRGAARRSPRDDPGRARPGFGRSSPGGGRRAGEHRAPDGDRRAGPTRQGPSPFPWPAPCPSRLRPSADEPVAAGGRAGGRRGPRGLRPAATAAGCRAGGGAPPRPDRRSTGPTSPAPTPPGWSWCSPRPPVPPAPPPGRWPATWSRRPWPSRRSRHQATPTLHERYGIDAVPTTIVCDAEGGVAGRSSAR